MTTKTTIKKNTKDNNKTFHRLENYFRALEQNQIQEYHKKRGRGEIKKI